MFVGKIDANGESESLFFTRNKPASGAVMLGLKRT